MSRRRKLDDRIAVALLVLALMAACVVYIVARLTGAIAG